MQKPMAENPRDVVYAMNNLQFNLVALLHAATELCRSDSHQPERLLIHMQGLIELGLQIAGDLDRHIDIAEDVIHGLILSRDGCQ